MPKLDLNARHAARAEQRAKDGVEPNVLVIGDAEYQLVPELPVAFMERMVAGDVAGALRAVVVVPAAKKGEKPATPVADILDAGITLDDLSDIVSDVYGETSGNSEG